MSTAGSDVVTVHLTITFLGGFSGKKIVYLGTTADGWHALGTWTVPGSPSQLVSATGMTPARSSYNPQATTASQFYSFTFNDSAGASSINKVNVLINNFVAGNAACYLAYFPSSQALYLVDDSGTGFVANPASGNSQCAIAAISSTASSQTLTVNLYVTFKSGLGGDRIAWTAATASNGQTPWQPVGTISVATPANGGHLYAGWIDTVGCNASHPITGWAMDLENPVSSPIVTVYVDGTATSTVATASNYRADLFADGIGSGYYGFSISSPSVLSSGTHTVAIYVGQIGTGVFLDGPSSCSPVRTGSPAVKQPSTSSGCPSDTYCALLTALPTFNGVAVPLSEAPYLSWFDLIAGTDTFGANISVTESNYYSGAGYRYDMGYANYTTSVIAPGNQAKRLDPYSAFTYLLFNSSALRGDFALVYNGVVYTSNTTNSGSGYVFYQHVTPALTINSITTNPSPLIAGQSGTVTFQGTGFGRAGTVTFSGPGSIPSTNYPATAAGYSASDSQFTIPVTPPSEGFYDVSVQESVDGLGFGFQPAKKGQPPQATGTIQAAGAQVNISITSIWSDQFPGVSINGLPVIPGVRGAGEKPTYVLMGTRYDDANRETAAVAGQISVSPASALSQVMVQVTPVGGSTGEGSGSLIGNTAYATTSPPSGVADYQLIAGVDVNGNGHLDANEIIARSSQTYRIVPNSIRSAILSGQSWLNGISTFLIPNAANLLNTFAYAVVPSGAVDPSVQTLSTIAPLMINEPCLSHNVGAIFSSSGATVSQYQFLVASPLGDALAKSSTMKSLVNFTKSTHEAEVANYFLNNPFTNDASFGPWSLVNSKSVVVGGSDCKNADTVSQVSTEFLQLAQGTTDFDLFFAMGSVDLSGTVYLHFSRNAGGIAVLDSYTLLGGTLVYDLYDFDYDTAEPAPLAAKVQAGFGTLGNGGRIYKILVYLDSSLPILI